MQHLALRGLLVGQQQLAVDKATDKLKDTPMDVDSDDDEQLAVGVEASLNEQAFADLSRSHKQAMQLLDRGFRASAGT